MTFDELVTANRSYRRFDESHAIDRQTLVELVDLTRRCASSSNRQPLRYQLVCTPDDNARVFATLGWAGYLTDWPGPAEGERPTGYIVVLGDRKTASHYQFDVGIAAQTMLLGACERGLGGCMIASVDRPALAAQFPVPEGFDIILVIALGKPAEKVVLEDTTAPDQIEYYRDADGVHHVPKRTLAELVVSHPVGE